MNSIQLELDKSLPKSHDVGQYLPSGKLQFDLWGAEPKSGRWNWTELKAKIAETGLRTLGDFESVGMSCNLLLLNC